MHTVHTVHTFKPLLSRIIPTPIIYIRYLDDNRTSPICVSATKKAFMLATCREKINNFLVFAFSCAAYLLYVSM